MANVLTTEDPTLAVVIERLSNLASEFQASRGEQREAYKDLRKEVRDGLDSLRNDEIVPLQEAHNRFEKRFNETVNRARGGYLVLIGLGSLIVTIVGLWDKIKAIFS